MKRNIIFTVSGIVLATLLSACGKNAEKEEIPSADDTLTGVQVTENEPSGAFSKLFVLNEGGYRSNNSSLDFLRFKDGNYISDAFGQMNPSETMGLGDTGNDMILEDGKLWIAMHASGMVHVISASDETLIATVSVPDPRNLATDGRYVYVSSYAGAVLGGTETRGKVFRISTDTYKVTGEVTVGCQPEGIGISGDRLYVANSGGFNAVKEHTVSVIDLGSFTLERIVNVVDNLKNIAVDENGKVWVSSYGNGEYDAGWNYVMTSPASLHVIDPADGQFKTIRDVHVSCMYMGRGHLLAIGNELEMEGGTSMCLYKVETGGSHECTKIVLSGTDAADIGTFYAICENPGNGDIYISDAGDYTDAGRVHCFDRNLKRKWSATAGVIPSKMVLLPRK